MKATTTMPSCSPVPCASQLPSVSFSPVVLAEPDLCLNWDKLSGPAVAPRCACDYRATMLDSKPFEPGRLLTGFAFTPMLSGFYPAIFLGEPSLMPLGLLVGYATAALMGLPMVVLFDRHHWRSWWQFAVGGAICALPVMAYVATLAPDHFRV